MSPNVSSCYFVSHTCLFQFADGLSYSKGKMEEAFRPGGLLEKPYKATKDTAAVKREDVDIIVRKTAVCAVEGHSK